MARPRKDAGQKRSERLTVYLTPGELQALETLAAGSDKTKVMMKALEQYRNSLAEPPAALRRAKLDIEEERMNTYLCGNGHFFSLEIIWPAPPRCCPACGTEDIKAGWAGTLTKGF